MTRGRPTVAVPLLALLVVAAASCRAHAAAEDGRVAIVSVRLGFGGEFKLGCWTQAIVTLAGGEADCRGTLYLTTPDPEGVPTTVAAPAPIAVAAGRQVVVRAFVRPGQDGGPLAVRLVDEHGTELAARRFFPAPAAGEGYFSAGRPAGNRLIVSFGSQRGLDELSRDDASSDELHATRAARVADPADLPIEWFGYEGVELLVLNASQAEQFRDLQSTGPEIAAISRWVERGGRVAIFCGAGGAEVIGPQGPLSPLVPGRFDAVVPLRESLPIETFGGGTAITAGQQFQLPTPRLTDIEGRILAFAGPEPEDLPLVVRARRGLGEITFVALDPDAEPLAAWSGRMNLVRQALDWPAASAAASRPVAAFSQHEDLMDRLRRALDGSFAGVSTIPFGWVAALVVVYIAMIGPGDYFFVKRVLRRMELTWLTFPLAVALVSAGAYWAAHRAKGHELRVNQVEVVDVDQSSGAAYGAVWTHYFNPQVARRDLRLTPSFAGRPVTAPSEQLVGWIGSTAFGLDGMQQRSGAAGPIDRGYSFTPQLDAFGGLPAEQWSTRTIAAHWTARVEGQIEADLTELNDGLLAGRLTNRTGVRLEDCLLMHRNWAYPLPALAPGAGAAIDDDLQPRTVRTALTIGEASRGDAAPRLDPINASVAQIARTMMFYEAMGGLAYAQSPSRYQSLVDLSRLLRGDQAILLARAADVGGSQWSTGEGPLASDDDRRWVFYRFILPLDPKPRMLP